MANEVIDSSGNGRHGTLSGTPLPTYSASPWSGFGNAITLDGVDRNTDSQGVNLGDVGVSTAFTAECRFRYDGTAGNFLFGKWGENATPTSQNFLLWLVNVSGQFRLAGLMRDAGGTLYDLQSTSNITAGTLNHGAMSWDGTTLRLFLNGVQVATEPVPSVQTPDATTTWIGRIAGITSFPDWPGTFLGVIDEVRLSSSARYTANFTPAATPFNTDASTAGLWHLDEGATGRSFMVF